jgi:hypothetical protein
MQKMHELMSDMTKNRPKNGKERRCMQDEGEKGRGNTDRSKMVK